MLAVALLVRLAWILFTNFTAEDAFHFPHPIFQGAIRMKRFMWVPLILFLIPAINCTTVNRVIWPPTKTPTPTPTPTMTPTPTGILGITMPVAVEGVQLQFFSVTTTGHWLFGTSDYTPKLAGDTFLVVKANVLTPGTAYSTVKDWDVKVNGSIAWVFNQSGGALSSIDSMTWVFIVSKSATSFTINLPGPVDVPLDRLY
jgi:hypothetical protein